MLCRQPATHSVQTSCIDIPPPHPTTLHYDRLQPSNMILLTCYLIPPSATNRYILAFTLASSSEFFLKTLA